MRLAITIVQLICGIAIILVVLLQSGKKAGLSGAIAGGVDTFLSKNKSRSADARLARMTKWVAAAFIILTIVLSII